MTLHQLHLICFAAGAIVHGTQAVLVVKLWPHTSGIHRSNARNGFLLCLFAFLWQFGNFFREFVQSLGFGEGSGLWDAGAYTREAALISFPILFSYMIDASQSASRLVRGISGLSRVMRYALWPWTVIGMISLFGILLPVQLVEDATLHLMLAFFIMFALNGISRYRVQSNEKAVAQRAVRATIVASLIAVAMFIVMLFGDWGGLAQWDLYIALAAMMTSVPFTVAIGYQLYQFPFMDGFVRESITGLMLLTIFCAAVGIGGQWTSQDLFVFWVVAAAIGLTYVKGSLSRWVERRLMGYGESIDEQEERVGGAIRGLTKLDEFGARVSEILRSELEAEWVEVGSEFRKDAPHRFEISGPSLMWLSLGPRVGGRQYMSRHFRLARTAALQLAAHHHQLSQHELRDLTARAQMRALQAQINPHFLFNTLNVLANLIHTSPAKAERLTEELAEIFRYALESTRLEWVRLEDELHFIESYLAIEKTRFEERLSYSFEIDPSVRSMRIPPMILQPLVENAIKHGIGPKVEGGTVRVEAGFNGDSVVLTVEDTGLGHLARSRHRASGIGLTNVRERLQHVYGDSSVLRLEEVQPAGTRAVLVLPQLVGVQS